MNLYTIQKDCERMNEAELDTFKSTVLDMISHLARELEKRAERE